MTFSWLSKQYIILIKILQNTKKGKIINISPRNRLLTFLFYLFPPLLFPSCLRSFLLLQL